jgi:hypothetical protein
MKEEHRNLCLGVLETVKKTNPDDYSYFPLPAESQLGDKALERQYREKIKEPRDLGMIIKKVEDNIYTSIAAWEQDVLLCFDNAKVFSKGRYSNVVQAAERITKAFQRELKKATNSLTSRPPNTTQIPATIKLKSATVSAPAAIVDSKTDPSTQKQPQVKLKLKNTSTITTSMQFPDYEKRCEIILKEIEKLAGSHFFASPIDQSVYPDYVTCITNLMDFSTIRSKLGFTTSNGRSGRYSNHNEFARCVNLYIYIHICIYIYIYIHLYMHVHIN